MSDRPHSTSRGSENSRKRWLVGRIGVLVLLAACALVGAFVFGRAGGALVAARQLNMGDKIEAPEEMFKREPSYYRFVCDVLRCFRREADDDAPVGDPVRLKGRILKRTLRAGDIVRPSDLFEEEGEEGIRLNDLRTVAIRVDPTMAAMLPHSRVDIHSTVQRDGSDPYTEVIIQDVPVLAVEQTTMRDTSGKASAATIATVGFSVEEALRLELAKNVGDVSVSLRRFGGKDEP